MSPPDPIRFMAAASMETVGDCYDNAMMESLAWAQRDPVLTG
jgi:hypothetical protein